jgi:hypothetical protein
MMLMTLMVISFCFGINGFAWVAVTVGPTAQELTSYDDDDDKPDITFALLFTRAFFC